MKVYEQFSCASLVIARNSESSGRDKLAEKFAFNLIYALVQHLEPFLSSALTITHSIFCSNNLYIKFRKKGCIVLAHLFSNLKNIQLNKCNQSC